MLVVILAGLCTLGCAIFGHAFMQACKASDYRCAFWRKGLAGLCFILVGLLLCHRCSSHHYAALIVGGLALGLLGDQLLALRFVWKERHDLMFALGAGSFAVGHVLYILALYGIDQGALRAGFPFFIAGMMLTGLYALVRRINAGKFQIPGVGYLALVVFMASVACGAAVQSLSTATVLFALGGICFAVSDNLLSAYHYGSATHFAVNRAVHATYYAAQLLIAWTLYFL